MKLNLFRDYDIRGLAPSQLNKKSAEYIGLAFGNFLSEKQNSSKAVVVSRDHRQTGTEISKGLIKGLRDSGKNIIYIGLNPTPVFYYAICKGKFQGGCQVTASHNPSEYNGIKLQMNKSFPVDAKNGIYKIRDKIKENNLKTSTTTTELKKKSYKDDYVDFIKSRCNLKRKLKIVIDTGNGVVGKIPEKIFKSLGCQVETIFAKPDDTFPNHIADPHKKETLKQLQEKVIQKKADIGFAYDGDGDRLGAVDSLGRIIDEEQLLMLLSEKSLNKKKGYVVYDIRVSKAVIRYAKEKGGKVLISRAGHSFVLRKIIEKNAVFGGELSGHFYYPLQNYPYDDGIFTSIKIAEIVSNINQEEFIKKLDRLPRWFVSPDIEVKSTDHKKWKQISELKDILKEKGYQINKTDGLKVTFKNRSILIRASNTGPSVKILVQGKTKTDLLGIVDEFNPMLKQVGLKIAKNKILTR